MVTDLDPAKRWVDLYRLLDRPGQHATLTSPGASRARAPGSSRRGGCLARVGARTVVCSPMASSRRCPGIRSLRAFSEHVPMQARAQARTSRPAKTPRKCCTA